MAHYINGVRVHGREIVKAIVGCPKCNAQVGADCVGTEFKYHHIRQTNERSIHAERWALWKSLGHGRPGRLRS